MIAIKLLATIFAVAVLVKIALILIRPDVWVKVADLAINNYGATVAGYLVLAVITGYYVLTNVNIVDVAAVMLFTSFLMGLTLAPYHDSLFKLRDEALRTGWQKIWLPLVIWAALACWVLYAAWS